MRSTTRNIIWTLLTHFFILVGMGHGIVSIGVIEILSFSNLVKPEPFAPEDATFRSLLLVVAVASLIGQIVLITSIFQKKETAKKALHLVGLGCLWLSVFSCNEGSAHSEGFSFSLLFAIPLMICTILPFRSVLAAPLKKWNKWMDS